MRAVIDSELISTEIDDREWNKIEDTQLFDQFETYDKIEQCKWSHDIDKNITDQYWQLETYSDPTAFLIAWIFQPCFNITTCTPFKKLVSKILQMVL